MLLLARPAQQNFVPIHGEYRMLRAHAAIAEQTGRPPHHAVRIADNGTVLDARRRRAGGGRPGRDRHHTGRRPQRRRPAGRGAARPPQACDRRGADRGCHHRRRDGRPAGADPEVIMRGFDAPAEDQRPAAGRRPVRLSTARSRSARPGGTTDVHLVQEKLHDALCRGRAAHERQATDGVACRGRSLRWPRTACDVLVLGGGPAGGVLAAQAERGRRAEGLPGRGRRRTTGPMADGRWPDDVLDARQLPVSHDWAYDDPSAWSARVIGGCSAHNACAMTWGAPADYDWGEGWSAAALEPSPPPRRGADGRGRPTARSRRPGTTPCSRPPSRRATGR